MLSNRSNVVDEDILKSVAYSIWELYDYRPMYLVEAICEHII